MTVPNTAVSVAGLGAALWTALEVVGGLDASEVTGNALGVAAAVPAVCPATEGVGGGDAGSVLTSGAPVAAGMASPEGARRLALEAAALGLPPAGWTGAGSFFMESEVCRGAWGSGAVDTETSLLPGFSGKDDDAVSSVLLAEDAGRVGAEVALRRLLNDKVGNDVARGVAEVAGGGVDRGPVLPACWLPNEKLVLLPLREMPPKPSAPEEPALVSGRLPKTPVVELLVLVAAAGGATVVVAVTEEVPGGSVCFPNTEGPVKLNPEGTSDVLVGCALVRLVDEGLLAGFVESSAWPTRSPEKLPRVSPAKEFGNSSSPNLDGVSNLLEGVERAIPEGATGLLLDGADSPGEAVAAPPAFDGVIREGEELSGTVSYKGLPPPPKENVSSWFDSLAGGVAPCVAVKLEDGVGVIIPKLKPVPDGENEKGLLNCPTADGVEVTAVSILVAPGPEALSLDDN